MDSLEWKNYPNYNIGLNIVNNLAVKHSAERAIPVSYRFLWAEYEFANRFSPSSSVFEKLFSFFNKNANFQL